jgi:serine/threonine-protein kinase
MPDPNEPLLTVGDELGGYQVEDYIARGGMAEIYRARDISSSEIVALKVIPPELTQDDQFRERFVQESRTPDMVMSIMERLGGL